MRPNLVAWNAIGAFLERSFVSLSAALLVYDPAQGVEGSGAARLGPQQATMPLDTLDLVADHLIITHSLIEEDGGPKAALPDLRMALLEVGLALAART